MRTEQPSNGVCQPYELPDVLRAEVVRSMDVVERLSAAQVVLRQSDVI
jgi:uncharacterized lipoprotein YmbA